MPTKLHNNLGEVLQAQYLPGIIKEVFPEEEGTASEKWDTALVTLSDVGEKDMPIFYHCWPESEERANGALKDAATGFDVGDEVIVMAMKATGKGAEFDQHQDYAVVAHKVRPKRCVPGLLVVRCEIEEQTYLTIYDIRKKALAQIKMPPPEVEEGEPAPPDEFYELPCMVEDIADWLEGRLRRAPAEEEGGEPGDFLWEEADHALFTVTEQAPLEGMQIAGGTPNWRDDHQGNIIRAGTPAKDWWNSYNFYGNPTYNFFWNAQLGLLTDPEGVANGTFARSMETVNTFDAQGWTGPGVRKDSRAYHVACVGVDGVMRQPASALHLQVGYGEDEIWVCGRNSFMGMIVSFCDQSWKYQRMETLPPTIPNANLAMEALASTAGVFAAMPAAGSIGGLGGVGMAMAASQFASFGGIFTFATLKRINEGAFSRISYPCMGVVPWLSPGSFVLNQVLLTPESKFLPTRTAMNCRYEKVDAWVRYDNWHNTIACSSSMDEADRTWFFRVWSTQTIYENYYWDTPLGSMFYSAPLQRSVLWWMYGLSFSTADLTTRMDWPIRTRHWAIGRQTSKALAQIYVVLRQAVTTTGPETDLDGRFWIQEAVKTPWECLPDPQLLEEDPVPAEETDDLNLPPRDVYVGYVEDGTRHLSTMSAEEIADLVEPLVFLHTDSEAQPNPLRESRNEIEIMAAAETYGRLFEDTGGGRPQDMERDAALEECIADLIDFALTDSGQPYNGFPQFELEATVL